MQYEDEDFEESEKMIGSIDSSHTIIRELPISLESISMDDGQNKE